jgi:hypothetical protein
LSEQKISDLEQMLEKRRALRKAAFVPGTDGETPPETVFMIVAERYGVDRARALKTLRGLAGIRCEAALFRRDGGAEGG